MEPARLEPVVALIGWVPVRLPWAPAPGRRRGGLVRPFSKSDNQLSTDAQQRLKVGDITYVLEAQFNKKPSDMGDARIDWDSPYVAVGRIVIPQQAPSAEAKKKTTEDVEKLSFKPWNRWDENDDRSMKPLGDVNEARKAVYKASSEARGSGGVNNHKCPMGYG